MPTLRLEAVEPAKSNKTLHFYIFFLYRTKNVVNDDFAELSDHNILDSSEFLNKQVGIFLNSSCLG